ncbi:TVP38/TMEM64 family protein [Luteibacter yeojuensis]|uniref:TVP38/TMEM64 family membrane protein n=1 Tax=Luteibacter yeojuensis TaxID=345309 RepID=A0A7X5QX94_9GAMM|nr:VTT domain-containing protein [Luteibacter yeojuensis]NID17122.1 TVP38/TMEM64 family protein [Luteibacter yeojuensis]
MLPLLLLLAGGAALFASGALDRFEPHRLLAEEGHLRAGIAANPVTSRLAFAGLLALAIATGVPGTILLVLGGGLLFGAVEGTALSSVALVLGSLALYLASRYAFGAGRKDPPLLAQRLRKGFAAHPVTYTLALRFVPVVPLGAMTVALAWLRCPLWLFIGATWLGGTVSLFVESSVGAGLGETLGDGKAVSAANLLDGRILVPLAAFAILTILPLAARTLVTRLRRPR